MEIFFDAIKNRFCTMVFESWETKFVMIVLHGNVEKNSVRVFFIYLFFVRQSRSKLPENPKKS